MAMEIATTQYINPDTPVYISYTGKDAVAAKELMDLLIKRNIYAVNNASCRIDSISEFENKIGEAKNVIIIVSPNYFTSLHCMNEYASIRKNEESKCIFMVKNGDFKLRQEDLIRFWGGEYAVMREHSYDTLTEAQRSAFANGCFLDKNTVYSVQNIMQFLQDKPTFNTNDLCKIVDYIKNAITAKSINYTPNLPKLFFQTRSQDAIVPRDKEAHAIKDLFSDNQMVNIVGLGGSGKTTISEWFVIRYKREFNYITGLFINCDFYKEMSDKYTDGLTTKYTLANSDSKNEVTIDYEKTFDNVVATLERYPKKDDKYNLMIIDINETADYSQIKTALDNIKRNNRLVSWKILVVSRELISSRIASFDTVIDVTKVDNTVLKTIFFTYLSQDIRHLYNFSEHELCKLFNVLGGLPLLVEQLAYYLNHQPIPISINEIFEYLDVDRSDFKNSSAISSTKYATIGDYLSRLIVFSHLDEMEKNIVRHLMLWPTEYYSYKLITDFITKKGDQTKYTTDWITNSLHILAEKSVVDFRIDENGDIQYKLSGLIAESCREQVFKLEENNTSRNYETYLNNIDEFDKKFNPEKDGNIRNIIAYSLACFIPFDEEYLLEKARLYNNEHIYNRALIIKSLKLKKEGISDSEIYRKWNSYIKESSSDQLYYEWQNTESNYSSAKRTEDNELMAINICGVQFEMVYVKGGTFKMGSYRGNRDEMPIHTISLNDYYICKTQITQKIWKTVMKKNPSRFHYNDKCPVENVSWYDCLDFIMRISKLSGLKFRLPSEAEWEFAANGGMQTVHNRYSGHNFIGQVGWYSRISLKKTHPVGMKQPNELGIYDMSGNVREWCQDVYQKYTLNPSTIKPLGQRIDSLRVIRGGSWFDIESDCRITKRFYNHPEFRDDKTGFRLVLSVDN